MILVHCYNGNAFFIPHTPKTYGTNDFTEYETVSDNEISLPFKPLTTRKKEGDTHEGKVVLGDDIYHFSLKAIEENRASKTYCLDFFVFCSIKKYQNL